MNEPARLSWAPHSAGQPAHQSDGVVLGRWEYEHGLQAYGRLDWVLGFAHDGLYTSVSAMFTPVLFCLEGDAANQLRVVSARRILHGRIVRTYKMWTLDRLQLGRYYAYDNKRRGPVNAPLPFDVDNSRYWKIKANLEPSTGAFYIAGGRHDLPAEIRRVVSMHANIPDGVAFFAFAAMKDNSNVTVVVPCAEILRSCYGHLVDLTSLEKTKLKTEHPQKRQKRRSTVEAQGVQAEMPSCLNESMARHEAKQLLPRALVFGHVSRPRPILIRPPFCGEVVISGCGFSDQHSEVVFIASRLSIEAVTDTSYVNG